MGNLEVWEKALAQVESIKTTYSIEIQLFLIDKHPAYTASQWVRNGSTAYTEIFHHHAHASALIFEHRYTKPMLVFTWDGTGYGKNGNLWGGEAFFGSPGNWIHSFSVKPFKLPGGISAIKEPWRIAASLCWHISEDYRDSQKNLENLKEVWKSNLYSPLTSSVGRLFDAAAVFLGLCDVVSYDGQAAMKLEAIATDPTDDFIKLTINISSSGIEELDWEPLLSLLQDSLLTQSYRAKVFHNSLANVILDHTTRISREKSFNCVGLTGGVFQNTILRRVAKKILEEQGFNVVLNETLPANDAVISLGQVVEFGLRSKDNG
jgi:hydrogenase maturation protein HypF